ncbi:hypothetical protein HGB07_00195 [Candidatus Roizmanbacteria bacterium]|nr:hypothetical protein [Candidatus Roizmanbacteria bacterium]
MSYYSTIAMNGETANIEPQSPAEKQINSIVDRVNKIAHPDPPKALDGNNTAAKPSPMLIDEARNKYLNMKSSSGVSMLIEADSSLPKLVKKVLKGTDPRYDSTNLGNDDEARLDLVEQLIPAIAQNPDFQGDIPREDLLACLQIIGYSAGETMIYDFILNESVQTPPKDDFYQRTFIHTDKERGKLHSAYTYEGFDTVLLGPKVGIRHVKSEPIKIDENTSLFYDTLFQEMKGRLYSKDDGVRNAFASDLVKKASNESMDLVDKIEELSTASITDYLKTTNHSSLDTALLNTIDSIIERNMRYIHKIDSSGLEAIRGYEKISPAKLIDANTQYRKIASGIDQNYSQLIAVKKRIAYDIANNKNPSGSDLDEYKKAVICVFNDTQPTVADLLSTSLTLKEREYWQAQDPATRETLLIQIYDQFQNWGEVMFGTEGPKRLAEVELKLGVAFTDIMIPPEERFARIKLEHELQQYRARYPLAEHKGKLDREEKAEAILKKLSNYLSDDTFNVNGENINYQQALEALEKMRSDEQLAVLTANDVKTDGQKYQEINTPEFRKLRKDTEKRSEKLVKDKMNALEANAQSVITMLKAAGIKFSDVNIETEIANYLNNETIQQGAEKDGGMLELLTDVIHGSVDDRLVRRILSDGRRVARSLISLQVKRPDTNPRDLRDPKNITNKDRESQYAGHASKILLDGDYLSMGLSGIDFLYRAGQHETAYKLRDPKGPILPPSPDKYLSRLSKTIDVYEDVDTINPSFIPPDFSYDEGNNPFIPPKIEAIPEDLGFDPSIDPLEELDPYDDEPVVFGANPFETREDVSAVEEGGDRDTLISESNRELKLALQKSQYAYDEIFDGKPHNFSQIVYSLNQENDQQVNKRLVIEIMLKALGKPAEEAKDYFIDNDGGSVTYIRLSKLDSLINKYSKLVSSTPPPVVEAPAAIQLDISEPVLETIEPLKKVLHIDVPHRQCLSVEKGVYKSTNSLTPDIIVKTDVFDIGGDPFHFITYIDAPYLRETVADQDHHQARLINAQQIINALMKDNLDINFIIQRLINNCMDEQVLPTEDDLTNMGNALQYKQTSNVVKTWRDHFDNIHESISNNLHTVFSSLKKEITDGITSSVNTNSIIDVSVSDSPIELQKKALGLIYDTHGQYTGNQVVCIEPVISTEITRGLLRSTSKSQTTGYNLTFSYKQDGNKEDATFISLTLNYNAVQAIKAARDKLPSTDFNNLMQTIIRIKATENTVFASSAALDFSKTNYTVLLDLGAVPPPSGGKDTEPSKKKESEADTSELAIQPEKPAQQHFVAKHADIHIVPLPEKVREKPSPLTRTELTQQAQQLAQEIRAKGVHSMVRWFKKGDRYLVTEMDEESNKLPPYADKIYRLLFPKDQIDQVQIVQISPYPPQSGFRLPFSKPKNNDRHVQLTISTPLSEHQAVQTLNLILPATLSDKIMTIRDDEGSEAQYPEFMRLLASELGFTPPAGIVIDRQVNMDGGRAKEVQPLSIARKNNEQSRKKFLKLTGGSLLGGIFAVPFLNQALSKPDNRMIETHLPGEEAGTSTITASTVTPPPTPTELPMLELDLQSFPPRDIYRPAKDDSDNPNRFINRIQNGDTYEVAAEYVNNLNKDILDRTICVSTTPCFIEEIKRVPTNTSSEHPRTDFLALGAKAQAEAIVDYARHQLGDRDFQRTIIGLNPTYHFQDIELKGAFDMYQYAELLAVHFGELTSYQCRAIITREQNLSESGEEQIRNTLTVINKDMRIEQFRRALFQKQVEKILATEKDPDGQPLKLEDLNIIYITLLPQSTPSAFSIEGTQTRIGSESKMDESKWQKTRELAYALHISAINVYNRLRNKKQLARIEDVLTNVIDPSLDDSLMLSKWPEPGQ